MKYTTATNSFAWKKVHIDQQRPRWPNSTLSRSWSWRFRLTRHFSSHETEDFETITSYCWFRWNMCASWLIMKTPIEWNVLINQRKVVKWKHCKSYICPLSWVMQNKSSSRWYFVQLIFFQRVSLDIGQECTFAGATYWCTCHLLSGHCPVSRVVYLKVVKLTRKSSSAEMGLKSLLGS